MAGVILKGRFPRRHIVETVAKNVFRYLFGGAARNWVRNIGSTAPALSSMTLLLLLSGLIGLSGFALFNVAVSASAHAALSVLFETATYCPGTAL